MTFPLHDLLEHGEPYMEVEQAAKYVKNFVTLEVLLLRLLDGKQIIQEKINVRDRILVEGKAAFEFNLCKPR